MILKKQILIVWILLSTIFSVWQAFWYSNSITQPENWYFIESSHIWSNDAERLFNWKFTNGNYWQTNWNWEWGWFHFYSAKKITYYTVTYSHSDNTFYPSSISFQANLNWNWTTIDSQTYSPIYWEKAVFKIQSPVLANEFRLYIVTTWSSWWSLITQLEMFDDATWSNIIWYEKLFDETDYIMASTLVVILTMIILSVYFFQYKW